MDRTNLTSMLRITRKSKKHRQQQIARWGGIAQSELSNIENGRVDIRLSTLKRLADALDLKIIAVPKDKLEDIESILTPEEETQKEETPSILLEKYGLSDDE